MCGNANSGGRLSAIGGRFTVYRLLLTVCCLLFFLSACASVEPVVKVGLVGPFEGANRAIGYDVIYSARLAVREVNAAGGIDGHRVSLVALDDGGDVALARETAVSLTLDPAVVAVVGHWLPETNAAVRDVYADAGLPLIVAGEAPFDTAVPSQYPDSFRQAYTSVTPFNETPGAYAASAYDAFQLIWLALDAVNADGDVTRTAVAEALVGLEYDGLTGVVYQKRP